MTREFIVKISDEILEEEFDEPKPPELVRCKDCIFYADKPDSHGDRCDRIHWSRSDEWFCADGKRR